MEAAFSSDRLSAAKSQTVSIIASHAGSGEVAKQKSNRMWQWLSAAVVASGTIAFLQPWNASQADTHAVADHPGNELKTVETERPTVVSTANVVLPATFRPWQTASLSARVSGYLTRWHRDLGEHVTAGELLAEIETPELDQEVASAEAAAREADAAALQAVAEKTEAEADLKTTQAQLVRVQAELDLSRSQLSRREKLVASKVITEEEFDTFSREVEARTAVVASAESDVARRRANLTTRSAIIDARYATARSRQSNVDRLRELQGFKRIVAPFDGVVTRRSAEIGMLVTAGRETLFVLEDMSRIRVQISVPQAYSMQTTPGVVTTVSVPESSLKSIPGTITRVSSSVDSASRTMLAEIELENSTLNLQPGSYGQVTLNTVHDHKTWTVPTNTVLMRVNGPHVAVVDEDNQIELRQVQLGRDFGSRVAVVSGIRGDEQLVVNPGDDLKNGTRIQRNERVSGVEVVLK
jgi:multidrug efflux pump subunit AcrA (membrane-fusion protein)